MLEKRLSWPLANCIAVGKRTGYFLEHGSPPGPFGWWDGEPNRPDAAALAQDAAGGKQAKAQGPGGDLLQPAQVPLEQHAEVVTQYRQRKGRLRAPELFQAQLRQPKV